MFYLIVSDVPYFGKLAELFNFSSAVTLLCAHASHIYRVLNAFVYQSETHQYLHTVPDTAGNLSVG